MNMGWQDPHVARQQRQREQQGMPWAREPRRSISPAVWFAVAIALYFAGQMLRPWL